MAYLVLGNGMIFEGLRIGAPVDRVGELVFTTGMEGYLETLTDPSYYGQIVTHSFPLIGNYGLIPEEGTPLFRDLEQGLLTLPDPDEEREMYGLVIRKADEAGLTQYEISNFARKGFECRHNIGYWTQVPYIGLGVSAASMTGARSGTEGVTCVRTVNPDTLSVFVYFFERDETRFYYYTFEETVPVLISGGSCMIDFALIKAELEKADLKH